MEGTDSILKARPSPLTEGPRVMSRGRAGPGSERWRALTRGGQYSQLTPRRPISIQIGSMTYGSREVDRNINVGSVRGALWGVRPLSFSNSKHLPARRASASESASSIRLRDTV